MKRARNVSLVPPIGRRPFPHPSRLGVGVMMALGLPMAAVAAPSPEPAPEPQQMEFSAAFVGASNTSYDLSRFERGNGFLPGDYPVDLFVNQMLVTRETLTFRDVDGHVQACFPRNLLAAIGVDTAKLEASGANLDGACLNLAALVSGASVLANAGDLRVDVSIPQIALLRSARGYVDPKLWENGVNAFTLGYSFNASQFDSQGYGRRQAYLGLEAGLSLGGWRVRNQSNLGWDEGTGLQAQNIRTYAQHDVDRLRSQFTVGETFTDGRLFDSVAFRGVNLATDDRMRPDSMNGFAPVVRGVAETNAHVIVRQAGYVIYDTTVAPGGFEIDDLGASGFGGDLEVTVEEADGRRRTFTVPFAAVPNLLRPGAWRYSATAGQLRNDFLTQDAPFFAEGTYQRGFSNLLTGYFGAQVAGSGLYRSALVGAAFNTSVGALALDLTGAQTRFSNNGGDYNGYSARVTYSKSIPSTNTDFALAAYRYSSLGYFDLQHAVRLDDAVREGRMAGGVSERTSGMRSRFQMTLSQRLGKDAGQLFLSGSRGDFWDGRPVETSYNAGWSNHLRSLSYNVSLNRARLADGRYDDTLFASFTVPLGSAAARRSAPPTLSMQASHASTGNGLTASINGAAGERNQFSYGVNGNFSDEQSSNNIGVNGQWRAAYANVGASYTHGSNSSQASVTANGGLVLHYGGITLANQLGDTIGLIEATDAKGASVNGNGRVDGRGYAVVSNLVPYHMNEVMLDPKDASMNVELDNARLLVAPRSGAVVPLKFKTTSGQAYVLHLTQGDGGVVPFGAEVVNSLGNVGLRRPGQPGRRAHLERQRRHLVGALGHPGPAMRARLAPVLRDGESRRNVAGRQRVPRRSDGAVSALLQETNMNLLIDRVLRWPAFLLLVTVALMLPHGKAEAASVSCSGPAMTLLTVNLGSPSYAVPRDLAVGQPIGPWSSFYETPANNWTCTIYSLVQYTDWSNSVLRGLPATAGTYTDSNGKTYPVYPTNVAGVGMVIGFSSYESYVGYDRTYFPLGSAWIHGIGTSPGGTYTGSLGFGVALRFVKTGPITPGAISFPGNIVEGAAGGTGGGDVPWSGVAHTYVQLVNAPSVTVLSCQTGDQDVDLGTHRTNEFAAPVGSTLPPVDFSIKVNNCPAGMTSVKYQLDLAPGIAAYNAASGIIKLDAASNATGVAVQVTSPSDVAYNFSTKPWQSVTPNYTGAAGNFTIPLRAKYYKTAATITPGIANSAIVFTMEYR